jgi:hypothetical protein
MAINLIIFFSLVRPITPTSSYQRLSGYRV